MMELTVTLGSAQELFVDEQVRSGAFPDAEAVVRAGLDRLKAERDDDAPKEVRYRALIGAALESVRRGEVERVDDVRAWLDGLGRGSPAG